MGDDSTTTQAAQAASLFAGEAWFDPIEAGIWERIRGFIEALFEEELTTALGGAAVSGWSTHPGVTATARASGTCWAVLVPCRSACPAPGWPMPRVAHGSGAARRCPVTPGLSQISGVDGPSGMAANFALRFGETS